MKKVIKKFKSFKSNHKFALGFVVGVIIALVAPLVLKSFNYGKDLDDQEDRISIVFAKVVAKNELVTASQRYSEVDKDVDSREFFSLFNIPFTKNSYWYRYVGTLKVAVDLSKAKLINHDKEKHLLVIQLEDPYISSNTPDMKESGVLEENNNILNPIKIKKTDAFRKKCMKKVEAVANKDGYLKKEAKENAEQNLNDLFKMGLGDDYKVKIEWKKPVKKTTNKK